MLTDNLAVLGPNRAAAPAAGQRAAAAVSGESFRDVFQSLTRSMERSRDAGREPRPAVAEKPADAAPAPAREPSRRPGADQASQAGQKSGRPAQDAGEAPEAPETTGAPEAPETLDGAEDAEKAAERGAAAALLPLDPVQQEIIERVAVLAADNGLDAQMLAALPEADLAELADWVLAGAGGLFPEASDFAAAAPARETAPALPGLGLEAQAQAFSQFDSLLQRVAAAPVRDTALVGDLVNLGAMPSLDVDRLAQAVLSAAGGAGAEGAEGADLRTLLAAIPGEGLRAALEAALAKAGDGAATLPEMPEVVLKSLAVEIVNVNNAELDAAGKRLALLNGLDNNARLRAEVLAQVRAADSAELSSAVSGEKLSANLENSPVAADLLETGTGIELTNDETASPAPQTANPAAALPETGTPEIVEAVESPAAKKAEAPAAKLAPSAAQTEAAKENTEEAAAPQETIDGAPLEEEEEAPRESRPQPAQPRQAPEKGAETAAAPEPEKEESAGDEAKESQGRLTAAPVRHEAPQAAEAAPEARENPAARQAALQENINRLAEMVDQAVKNDNRTLKSLTMALTPPELGEVRVELEMTKAGGVSATVKVENDSARTLLLSGLDQLRKGLEAQGVSLEQFNVEMDGKDAGAEEQQRQQQQAAGGDWSGAQSQERGRRARAAANRAGAAGAPKAETEPEETAAIPAMRHIDGNSFELIA